MIPNEWRRKKIVPILKAGKNLDELVNYRPISLISALMKFRNSMVRERLILFLYTYDLNSDRSFAYQKYKSTNMYINDLIFTISREKRMGTK